MKILHYALGFPPYRTGGSTKFCLDLLGQQKEDGHQVALIWPGRMGFFRRRVSIKAGEYCQIQSYEICGPLPVPYDEGISQCHLFTEDAGREAYKRLLEDLRPDVLHVHTFMGLHRSFLEIAKEMGVRCVFTAHDHFPICPKVTMVRHGQVCPSVGGYSDCGECNRGALSMARIKILQSVFYRNFKETAIVCRLRERHRDRYLSGDVSDKGDGVVGTAEDHKRLRRYYHSLLKKMDMIHYNSTVTRSVYERYFHLPHSVVIGISHKDIQDRRKRKEFSPDRLRLSYLGPQGEAKGFFCSRRHLIDCGRRANGLV